MVADVEHAIGRPARGRIGHLLVERKIGLRRAIKDADHAFCNIVDIGEVAPHPAMVEDVDSAAFEYGLGEQEQRHVGPAPGAIYGEEAQAGGGQREQMAVGVGHQLVGLLGRGVEADRMIDVVVLGKRHALIAAVDAGTAGIDKVLDAVVATAFENIDEADHVAIDIGMGILQRIAHTGLRREVDHALRAFRREQGGNALAIGDIQPRQLEARTVIIVEVVHPDHFVAARQQQLADVHADKPGGAGDQYFHGDFR